MQYKLNVFLNRIPDNYNFTEDFAKASAYHEKHGVVWQANFHYTDIHGYTSVFNASKNRWLISGADTLLPLDNTADVNIFVYDMNEWSNGPGMLKPNVPTGSCTVPQTPHAKPFVCIGTYPSDHTSGITWVQIAHEVMHSYCQNALLTGTYINDVMDSYRENNNPDSPTGNFAEQWSVLKPWIASKTSQEAPRATLTRLYDWGRETVGKLVVDDGGWVCNTLELGWKQNQTNISSITPGTYQVKYTYSFKFLKYTYEILNVKGRSGIRIHSANLYSQLLGCIALGRGYDNLDTDGLPDILNSRDTVSQFENLMGRKDFILVIK